MPAEDALGTGIRNFNQKPTAIWTAMVARKLPSPRSPARAGNGGPDLIAVFTLTPNGKVLELPIEPRKMESAFQGARSECGSARTNDRGHRELPAHREVPSSSKTSDPGCCASAGTRVSLLTAGSRTNLFSAISLIWQLLPPSTPPSGPSRAIRAIDVKKMLDHNTFGFVPESEMTPS